MKQDNPEDINTSDIGLRKHAVLETAKHIFISLIHEREGEDGCYYADPLACIEVAEVWHTAQEEYINKED